jgi:nucleoside-diphosphate-sugar epimerase
MIVLITGGAGNLGRCLAAELVEHGHRVTLFDRVEPSKAPAPWQTDLPFVSGELTSGEDVRAAVETARAEAICHVGAIPYATDHPKSKEGREAGTMPALPDDETFKVNAMGTYYILDAAQRAGVKQVLFASTFFVLGLGFRISDKPWWPSYLPIDEDHPNTPEDTYSLSKVINEEMLDAYTRAYGIRTVAFRLMGVYYHHRDDSDRRFHQTAEQAGGNHKPEFGAWLYVDGRDVAQAFRLALGATNLEPHERFYLASDRTIEESPRDATRRLFPNLAHLTEHLGPDDFLISIGRARTRLGFEPQYSWRKTQ